MAAMQYNLIYGDANDDGIALLGVPEPASGTLMAVGGYALKDPGGTITDEGAEMSPNATGANPIGQCPLIGSYVDTDGSHLAGMLLFAAPPGVRVVAQAWSIVA